MLETLRRGDALEAGRLVAAPVLDRGAFGQLLSLKLVYVVGARAYFHRRADLRDEAAAVALW
jgi:hypothetical protein